MTDPPPSHSSPAAPFAEMLSDLTRLRDDLRRDRPDAMNDYRSRVQIDDAESAATRVRTIRGLLDLDPAPFAAFLGVSAATVRSWERGRTAPGGAARRFLEEIAASPEHFRERAGTD